MGFVDKLKMQKQIEAARGWFSREIRETEIDTAEDGDIERIVRKKLVFFFNFIIPMILLHFHYFYYLCMVMDFGCGVLCHVP